MFHTASPRSGEVLCPWPLWTSVFQWGLPTWPTWGVHLDLHSGFEEGCPEGHHLPLPDIWSAGLPTGSPQSLFPHCLLPYLFPACSLLSLPWSLTFYSSNFLSSRFCCFSSLFCIVIHFPLRFLLSHDTFSILSLFSFHAPFVLLILHAIHFLMLPVSLSLLPLSSLSVTFIVIHVRSMMKHLSPSESP